MLEEIGLSYTDVRNLPSTKEIHKKIKTAQENSLLFARQAFQFQKELSIEYQQIVSKALNG